MKLNLGCGQQLLAGYVNVDKHGQPDELVDLEEFPWPWEDDAAQEVVLWHVLEHLGADAETFIGVMQELYRVCAPGATVKIGVPHPRHDDFLGDPTHVRVVTPQVLSLFSRVNCLRWKAQGAANSPLALYHGVDFEVREQRHVLEEPYCSQFDRGEISALDVDRLVRERNNVVREIRMVVEVIKPAAKAPGRKKTKAPAERADNASFGAALAGAADPNRVRKPTLLEWAEDLGMLP